MKGHVHFAHIKMNAVLCWIVLCCWQETQAKFEISMLNRTRVALAGEVLGFNLSLEIPANHSSSLVCYTQNRAIWSKHFESKFSDKSMSVTPDNIIMHNSSSSGNYYFRITLDNRGQFLEVHWVVHVRDKGYEEPNEELEDGIITMLAFSGILLIFSVAGSLYILKSYKDQTPCRDEKNAVAEQRPEDCDDVTLDEDPASASLYTALQHRSSSIYDTLNEENTRETNSVKKPCEAPEEVFDSIYENL